MKKILITGGTGFIGRALCDTFLAKGHLIYILTRNKEICEKSLIIRKNYISNLNEIKNIDIDIVINLAGETIAKKWTNENKKNIYDSRILTTKNLVDHMVSASMRPELFISASAVGYYGTHKNKIFEEETENLDVGSGFASFLCKSWENEAYKAVASGIRTVILRIGPTFSKEGGIISSLLPSFSLGLGTQIGDGKQWLSWIDREDLIKLILFIINHPNIEGPVNAVSPNPVTNKYFSLMLTKFLKKPCFFRTPAFVFRLIFGEMAEDIMIKGQKVLPTKAFKYGFKFSYPKIEQSFSRIFRL